MVRSRDQRAAGIAGVASGFAGPHKVVAIGVWGRRMRTAQTAAGRHLRAHVWSRARPSQTFDAVSAVAAIASVLVWASQSTMEQSPADPQSSIARDAGTPAAAALAGPARETLFAVYSGVPYTYPSDVAVKKDGVHDFTVKDVNWFTDPFHNPVYCGWRILRWGEAGRTGTMIDFTHSKEYAPKDQTAAFEGTLNGKPAPKQAKIEDVFKRLEASHGHNMLTLNGLFRLPSWGLSLYPYVGLGAGVTLPHSEVHVEGEPSRTYEYQFAGPVVQAIAGVEFRLPRMSYFAEYKFTLANYEMPLTGHDGGWLPLDLWRQLQNWRTGTEPPGGRLTTRFTSHQAIAGLGFRVGVTPAAPAR